MGVGVWGLGWRLVWTDLADGTKLWSEPASGDAPGRGGARGGL